MHFHGFSLAGVLNAPKISSNIKIPIWSARSSSSGAGGLWDVRMALQPMSCSISNCLSAAGILNAAPMAPRSWCWFTPWMYTLSPFTLNPSPLYWTERIPKRVLYSSMAWPLLRSLVIATYRFGSWDGRGPQSRGFCSVTVLLIVCFFPGPRDNLEVGNWPTLSPAFPETGSKT